MQMLAWPGAIAGGNPLPRPPAAILRLRSPAMMAEQAICITCTLRINLHTS